MQPTEHAGKRLPGLLARCLSWIPALLLAACASRGPGLDRASAVTAMQEQPERVVIVAVSDLGHGVQAHAGSTMRDYADDGTYGASDRAQATLDELASRFHLSAINAWTIGTLRLRCVAYSLAPGDELDTVLEDLRNDRRVRIAEPMQTFGTLSVATAPAETPSSARPAHYNDPYFQLQQGFLQIDAGQAQEWSSGDGVRIAIVDTGVDIDHEDLRGRVVRTADFIGDDDKTFRSDRHGTEVAGIIAATANNNAGIVGVAPQAHLIVLKACWQLSPDSDTAQCNSFTLAEALGAAMDDGAQIINLSLGGPPDPLLEALVREALKRGIIVTAAVPPDAHGAGFPIVVPGVIAVDRSDRIASDSGALHAPGNEVVSLTPGGHYDFVSGSSFATAHVTGVVALLLSRSPHLSAETIQALLLSTSDRLPAGGSGGERVSINACAALSQLLERAGCAAAGVGSATTGMAERHP